MQHGSLKVSKSSQAGGKIVQLGCKNFLFFDSGGRSRRENYLASLLRRKGREEHKFVPIASPPIQAVSAPSSNVLSASASTKQSFLSRLWGEDGFSFGDILDTLNPLQHLPIVSALYRAFTGDAIAPAPRVLGDALFGGPLGAAAGVVNAALKYLSGKDAGEHMLALLPLPTRVEGETVVLALNTATPSSLTTTPTARGESGPTLSQKAVLARATDQARFVAALDAYSRNSRLLAPVQRQNRFGVRFY